MRVASGWLTTLVLSFLTMFGVSAASAQSTAAPVQPPLNYGVSWYPEHRAESTWDADLKLIRDGGFTFVRVGEFSWARLEPSEGKFDFSWLDRAIARAKAFGLQVIIGTPTAGPPAWLTTKYPEVLPTDENGIVATHGARRHYRATSPVYQEKSRIIASALATRYGRNDALIGMQIDNEYGRATYDAATRKVFQNWLQAKYKTLDALNTAWFTIAWSQTYNDWAQVQIPNASANPGLYLDWMRFHSETFRDFQQVQIDAIRPHLGPKRFITHNFTGRYDNFDFGLTAQPLDLVTWDWYFETPVVDPADGGLLHDMYRGFLGKNVWVLEAAAGNTNWAERNYTMLKGEARAMAWQAVAHGADGFAFWTWRPALGGIEQFHGALTDPGGRPQPIYTEAAQIGRDFKSIGAALQGSEPVADTAMLHDYPNRWAMRRQPMTKDFDAWRLFVDFYRATRPAVAGIAVLRGPERLERYKLVVAPGLHIVTRDDAAKLTAYVSGGGHLVLGPRSGVKDETGLLWEPGQPGPLSELVGAHVDQVNIPPGEVVLKGDAGSAKATIWAERLAIDAKDASATLRYVGGDGWLDGQPGAVTRRVGRGRVTYLGAWLDVPSLAHFMATAAADAGAKPVMPNMPDGVELASRTGPKGQVDFVINWSPDRRTVALPTPMRDLIDNKLVAEVTLDRFGVAALTKSK